MSYDQAAELTSGFLRVVWTVTLMLYKEGSKHNEIHFQTK